MQPIVCAQILAVFILFGVNFCNGDHLCGKVYARDIYVFPFNLTYGATRKAEAVFWKPDVGRIVPEIGCSFQVSDKNLSERAMEVNSFESNHAGYDLENTIGKDEPQFTRICCFCNRTQCQGIDLEPGVCAMIFTEPGCNSCFDPGHRIKGPSKEPKLVEIYPRPSRYRPYVRSEGEYLELYQDQRIQSAVVNWGCKLKLYEEPNFGGTFNIFYNGVHDKIGSKSNEWGKTGSYECNCLDQGANVAQWITLVSSKEGNQDIERNASIHTVKVPAE